MSSKPTVTEGTVTSDAPPAPERSMQRAVVEGHGNSPAAWTLVLVALAGALICSIAFVLANLPLFIVGAVVMVIGFALGIILRAIGYGVGGDKVIAKGPGH